MRLFARTIGIDYSGAQTPAVSLKALCVYLAEGDAPPVEMAPPPSPRKYWSRRGIAEWRAEGFATAFMGMARRMGNSCWRWQARAYRYCENSA